MKDQKKSGVREELSAEFFVGGFVPLAKLKETKPTNLSVLEVYQ